MMRLGVGEESAGDRFYERQGFVTVGGQGFVLGGEDQTDFVVVRALGDDECAARGTSSAVTRIVPRELETAPHSQPTRLPRPAGTGRLRDPSGRRAAVFTRP
jgi:hypothetical protein